MCRLALYSGPPAPLSATLYDPPRSLEVLAHDPRELLHGTVNVDGTGVAWWPPGDGVPGPPLRYVTTSPPWSDANLRGLAGRLEAVMSLAAVRSTTPGIPHGTAAVAPFVHGSLACAHNGWIGGFRAGTGRALVSALPDHLFGAWDTASDSLALFLTLVGERERQPTLVDAVVSTLARVVAVVADHDQPATLNVAVADGAEAVVTRFAVGGPANSLYVSDAGGRVVVASEPLDDGGWKPVDERHLVHVVGAGADVRPLDL